MLFGKNLFYKLEYKFGRYAVRNLMVSIVLGMGVFYLLEMMRPGISGSLLFYRDGIMQGQFWRVISFIFIPPATSFIFVILVLYVQWMIGSALESNWGAFKFNVFYFSGVLGAVIGGLITGYASNTYLNSSLFLAFAILFPNMEFRIYFLIPVKAKYLAYITGAFYVYSLIFNSWAGRVSLVFSLINLILFFGGDFISMIKRKLNQRANKAKWERNIRRAV